MSPEDQVLATFHRIRDAYFACDSQALATLIAEDYFSITIYGTVETREAILAAYSPGQVQLETFEVEEQQIKMLGAIAMMTGKGSLSGRFGTDHFAHRLRFCDLYRRNQQHWQLIFSQGTPILQPDPEK